MNKPPINNNFTSPNASTIHVRPATAGTAVTNESETEGRRFSRVIRYNNRVSNINFTNMSGLGGNSSQQDSSRTDSSVTIQMEPTVISMTSKLKPDDKIKISDYVLHLLSKKPMAVKKGASFTGSCNSIDAKPVYFASAKNSDLDDQNKSHIKTAIEKIAGASNNGEIKFSDLKKIAKTYDLQFFLTHKNETTLANQEDINIFFGNLDKVNMEQQTCTEKTLDYVMALIGSDGASKKDIALSVLRVTLPLVAGAIFTGAISGAFSGLSKEWIVSFFKTTLSETATTSVASIV